MPILHIQFRSGKTLDAEYEDMKPLLEVLSALTTASVDRVPHPVYLRTGDSLASVFAIDVSCMIVTGADPHAVAKAMGGKLNGG